MPPEDSSVIPRAIFIQPGCTRLMRLALIACLSTGASPLLHAADPVGATVSFTSYEGEAGTLMGGATTRALAAPMTTPWSSPELEASGRAFVELDAEGESVTWTNETGAPVGVINVRYSVPDAPTGGGIDTTLNLYVDGIFRQAVPLSSRQIWLYDEPPGTPGSDSWNGMGQDPALGNPHVFFEEGHFWVTGDPIAPGGTITFRKDPANSADFYWIDIVDVEPAPAALAQPPNSLSITSYGAVATPTFSGPLPADPVDCSTAIRNCINAARAQGKSVWIPPGRYVIKASLSVNGVTMEGAGVWHSKLYRNLDLPASGHWSAAIEGNSCTLRNFFIDANSTSRYQADGDWGGVNISGNDWLVDGLWVQHTSSGVWAKGNNGVVRNCRTLSCWGDGVNLNNGNTGNVGNFLLAEHNYVRGCGDDGVTINSDITSTQMESPILRNNTSVAIWWADSLRVAGGRNVIVQNNLLVDPAKFPGIIIGTFNGQPVESALVEGNVIIRGGGNAYNQHKSALDIGPGDPFVADIIVRNNIIRDSIQYAVKVQHSSNVFFENNTIDGIWEGSLSPRIGRALNIVSGTTGSGVFNTNVIENLLSGQTGFTNSASSSTYAIGGIGNTGFTVAGGVPAPWTSQGIGALGVAGGATQANDVFTLVGSGSDIHGTEDAFQFVHRSFSGNGTLTARVRNIEEINPWSKSGVMIRESLAAASANCAVVVTPGNGVAFQWRSVTGGPTTQTNIPGVTAPCWVRLDRSDQTFAASYSTDGTTWLPIGSPVTLDLPATTSIGAVVTSHDDSTLCSTMIDNLSAVVKLPEPWQAQDIGSVGVAGDSTHGGGTFTISGSGSDIWNSADAFRFVHRPLEGDGSLTARVVSVENTNVWAKAGVMIRESLAAGSKHASMVLTPGVGVSFQRRITTTGTSTSTTTGGLVAPYWVRITRSGSTFTASRSADGNTWTVVGSVTLSMSDSALVGLAVTSHDNTTACTAVFDNVSLTRPPEAPTDLSATPLSESQLELSWINHATDATAITVQILSEDTGWTTLTSSLPPTATSYRVENLNASAACEFRVRCENSIFSSSFATLSTTTPAGIGDGIPGWWRLFYFGNGLTLIPSSALDADPDGDGSGNESEYLGSTSPIDGDSLLRIREVLSNGVDITVRFQSATGKTYMVEKSAHPGSGPAWSLVADDVAGTGGVIEITDPSAVGLPMQFYRVRLK